MLLDESGFIFSPTVRRTYTPIGRTPTLRRDCHDRISAINCVRGSPGGRRCLGLHFQLLPDNNVNGEKMVRFSRDLRRQRPCRMRIVWDRGNVDDRSRVVRAFRAKHPSIRSEQFPSYTTDADPDGGRGYTKHGRPANFLPGVTAELHAAVAAELTRFLRSPKLLASFIRLPNLSHLLCSR